MPAPPPERTFRLRLAYDGTALVGWQRQPEGRSVQGDLEGALSRLAGVAVAVIGAGRTDAGVHASGQVASVRLPVSLDAPTLRRALNGILPGDIRVLEVTEAAASFHARYAARTKTYEYRIVNGPVLPPALRTVCWHVPYALDLERMRAEAAAVEGEHDFSAFQSAGSPVRSAVRRVLSSEVLEGPLGAGATPAVIPLPRVEVEGRLLVYLVRGTGFLRHMVRALVGTIVEVGSGRLPAGSVARLLAGGATRGDAGATAPALGLCLATVEYSEGGEVAAHR